MDNCSIVTQLDRQLGIPGVVTVCRGNGGMPKVQIHSSLAEGELYLQGAQVTSWKPAGAREVLFLSTKSRWEEGQAIRGGIPICFPWFRAKRDDPKAPAHGFVRTRTWQLESVVQNEAGVVVSLSTESDDRTQRLWPQEFRLLLRATFGSELVLELVCTNTGTTPAHFEEALHTYNRVADVRNARVDGLERVPFLDNTDSNKKKIQDDGVAIVGRIDNAYMNTENAVDLVDPGMRRRIGLTKRNSESTVVWNPWEDGANGMRDLSADEWRQFLCVEASNILDHAVHLEPGHEHRMTAVLGVANF